MRAYVLALSCILYGCNFSNHSGETHAETALLPVDNNISTKCFTNNNIVNANSVFITNKKYSLFEEPLALNRLGGISATIANPTIRYIGTLELKNNGLDFVPASDNKADNKISTSVRKYIDKLNLEQFIDVTDMVLTSKWQNQYADMLETFRTQESDTFTEYTKKKMQQLKQTTNKCIVEIGDPVFLNALEVSLIKKHSIVLKDAK